MDSNNFQFYNIFWKAKVYFALDNLNIRQIYTVYQNYSLVCCKFWTSGGGGTGYARQGWHVYPRPDKKTHNFIQKKRFIWDKTWYFKILPHCCGQCTARCAQVTNATTLLNVIMTEQMRRGHLSPKIRLVGSLESFCCNRLLIYFLLLQNRLF